MIFENCFKGVQKMRFFRGYRKLYFVAALVILLSFLTVHIVQAVTTSAPDPGSDNDPIVSQSYVDGKINTINASMNDILNKINDVTTNKDSLTNSVNQLSLAVTDLTNKVNNSTPANTTDLSKKVDELSAKVDELSNTIKNINVSTAPQYQVYKLLKGKQIIPAIGTEIIIRIGTVKAVKGKNGNLLDLTAGTEISSTANLPINRLLLSHMDDGRGLKAIVDSWLLVKGTYILK